MSVDYTNKTSSLTVFGINSKPKEIDETIQIERYKAFVGDADLGLRNFFKDKIPFQRCHQHAINDVSFFLWKEGMRKKQLDYILRKFKAILYTLQNSTKKYWKDNKTRRLVNRIIKTRKYFMNLATKIAVAEKHDAARYIMDHIEHMVTSAKLA